MVVVLDRPRHAAGIAEIREAGARVRLISHGDVSAALLAVTERRPSICCGGSAARRRESSRRRPSSASVDSCSGVCGRATRPSGRPRWSSGYDLERVLDRDDLVAGDDVFFSATGITDGDVLQGVRYPSAGGATTESLVMRTRSGTFRPHPRHARSRQARGAAWLNAAARRPGSERSPSSVTWRASCSLPALGLPARCARALCLSFVDSIATASWPRRTLAPGNTSVVRIASVKDHCHRA